MGATSWIYTLESPFKIVDNRTDNEREEKPEREQFNPYRLDPSGYCEVENVLWKHWQWSFVWYKMKYGFEGGYKNENDPNTPQIHFPSSYLLHPNTDNWNERMDYKYGDEKMMKWTGGDFWETEFTTYRLVWTLAKLSEELGEGWVFGFKDGHGGIISSDDEDWYGIECVRIKNGKLDGVELNEEWSDHHYESEEEVKKFADEWLSSEYIGWDKFLRPDPMVVVSKLKGE